MLVLIKIKKELIETQKMYLLPTTYCLNTSYTIFFLIVYVKLIEKKNPS